MLSLPLTIHRSVARTAAALLVLVATGCSASTEPDATVVVGLTARSAARDSLGYADIGFTVTNAGSRAVYVQRCGAAISASVDRRAESGSDWQVAFMSSAGCYSSLWLGPYRLEPGRTVNGRQSARVSAGEVRLRVQVSSDSTQSAPRYVSSDVITIR